MSESYAYEHGWNDERIRLAGLEAALDPGTRQHLLRLGASPGWRCLEIGAGGGSVAFWLAEHVAPGGQVVATDLETDFLEAEAAKRPGLAALLHDITVEDLPTGFDLVHSRWVTEWLVDKRAVLARMMSALKPGGVMIVEDPDFVTVLETAEPPALRRFLAAGVRHLQAISPVDPYYGRSLPGDLIAVGLAEVEAEGRCPVVRGGSPPAAHFLGLTFAKFEGPLIEGGAITKSEFVDAMNALNDPSVSVVMPMTVAAWGRRR